MDLELIIKDAMRAAMSALMGELDPIMKRLDDRLSAVETVTKTLAADNGADIAPAIDALKGALDEAIADVRRDLETVRELKALPGPKGDPGEPGQPGKDAEPVEIAAVTEAIKNQVITDMTPAVENIAADVAKQVELVATLVATAEEKLAEVKDGLPGAPGEPGTKGDPGAPGKDGASVVGIRRQGDAVVFELSDKSIHEIELRDGAPGAPGEPGKDGTGLAGALIDRKGQLVVTLTDGKAIELGEVCGRDGEPGAPGFSLDDFDVEQIDSKSMLLSFRRGDLKVERTLRLPGLQYREVFKEGEAYQRDDAVTYNGCMWIALKDTSATPGEEDSGWRLAVKKGRDGRDTRPPKSIAPEGPVQL